MSRGPAKVGGDVLAFVGEANQFSPAFDHDAETLQRGDQQWLLAMRRRAAMPTAGPTRMTPLSAYVTKQTITS